jgi:hypothetical protein
MRKDEICLDVIDHPGAWLAADVADESTWVIQVDSDHIRELEKALTGVRDLELTHITRDGFPLPTLGPVLDDVVDTLENGRGFVLLRGIPTQDKPLHDVERLYFGLSTHLGRPILQNRFGSWINHVMVNPGADRDRSYTANQPEPPHSDPAADILGLLCLSGAVIGGMSTLVSAMSVHNSILTHHRELLGLLYKEYCYDKGGAEAPGEPPFIHNQIFGYFEGRLACRYYARNRIDDWSRKSGIPISDVENAAFDLFEETAADPAFQHTFTLRPGDLILLENNYTLHGRTAFDDRGGTQRRHLLRIAVNPYVQRTFPPGFAVYREGWPQTEAPRPEIRTAN